MCASGWTVFASYPPLPIALSADLVDHFEQVRVVHFTYIGFVAFRHAGNLKMPDMTGRQVLSNFHGKVTLDNLCVVQVHLHLQIHGTHFSHDVVGLILSVQKETWDVPCVDRLNQHVTPACSGLGGAK